MNSIKCPDCGLVNFADASDCKRCHLSFAPQQEAVDGQYANAEYSNAQYQSYWPQTQQETKQRVFSGGLVFLTAILGVGMALFVLQQAFHPFDADTAKGFGGIVGLIGILLMILTHIWMLIRIFEQSVGWGLAALFLPILGYIAIGKFWEKTKRSFVGQFVCLAIVFVGFGIGA